MNRQEKINALKGILNGSIKWEEMLELNVHRLTTDELYLILSLLTARQENKTTTEQNKLIENCVQYYKIESNKRPSSIEEQRGYPIAGDPSYSWPGAEKVVSEWHIKIGLNVPFKLKSEA